jgi:hypothetical protein
MACSAGRHDRLCSPRTSWAAPIEMPEPIVVCSGTPTELRTRTLGDLARLSRGPRRRFFTAPATNARPRRIDQGRIREWWCVLPCPGEAAHTMAVGDPGPARPQRDRISARAEHWTTPDRSHPTTGRPWPERPSRSEVAPDGHVQETKEMTYAALRTGRCDTGLIPVVPPRRSLSRPGHSGRRFRSCPSANRSR